MYVEHGTLKIFCGPESLIAQGLIPQKTIYRFLSKIGPTTPSGCWPWLGKPGKYGYGYFNIGMSTLRSPLRAHNAHHAAYMLFVGPVPDGFHVDHLCHPKTCKLGDKCPHRLCVRISHIEAVTAAENRRRGRTPGFQEDGCIKGHPWTPESTLTRANGYRQCRICAYARERARYAARTANEVKRHANREKTHCKQGHEYTPENTIVRNEGRGRQCRICQLELQRKWYAKNKNPQPES